MNKTLVVILLTLGIVACQQNNNQETNAEELNTSTKPIQTISKYCTKDLKICPDGKSVARNPKNNCEFDACAKVVRLKPIKKEPMMCTADVKKCPDGSFVGRDHYNNCKFKECPNGTDPKDKI